MTPEERIAEALERMAPAPMGPPDFDAAPAFVWHVDPDRLEPVGEVNRVDLSLLLGIDRSRDTQSFSGICIPILRQIPGRIQSRLIICQSNPKGGQGTQPTPRPTIRAAHFDELLGAGFWKCGCQMICPIAQRRSLPRQRWQFTLHKVAK